MWTFDCGSRLIDTLSTNAIDNHPIPFVFKRSEVQLFYEQGEYDYGVIRLSNYYSRLLTKNGVKPLDEEVWRKQPSMPQYHLVIGIPQQLTNYSSNESYISPTMLFIEKLNQKPPQLEYSAVPHFYGKVILPHPDFDIKGMSGGPILALQYDTDGHLRYWIVALLISWQENYRYIIGCWITEFGNFLETLLIDNNSSET